MDNLSKKEQQKIKGLRKSFPAQILVDVHRSEDGGFCVEVKDFPGCFTEAETLSELIEMVNDAMRTFFEIPEKYRSYMPSYLPPTQVAQQLDVFPVATFDRQVTLVLPTREQANSC